jgi:DNA-binding GntR family transcriptional regulator
VALVTSTLPIALFPIWISGTCRACPYRLFDRLPRLLNWAEEEIGATNATDEQAAYSAPRGQRPVVRAETTYDLKRTAIEHSHSYLRADRYKATVVSVRKR